MILTEKQTIALDVLEDSTTTEVLFGGGAGGGKSALGCYWLLKMCYKYPKTRWLMGRSVLKSLKEPTLQTFFEMAALQGIPHTDLKYSQHHSSVTCLRTGSTILLKDLGHNPSDPEFQRLGSLEITGAFIDEAGEITQKCASIVASRIRYKLDENDLVPKLLMTCNPVKNWIYNEFYKPDRLGKLPEYKRFIQSLVTDNPHLSKHYTEQLTKLDRVSRMRLLQGDWEYENTEDRLYQYDKLKDAFLNSYIGKSTNYLSCDVARFGVDKTVICYWSGWRLEDITIIKKSNLVEVANKIISLANKFKVSRSNIIIDEDGMGSGVVDMVRNSRGFRNGSKALDGENYKNLKTQCYYKMADKINNGEVFFGGGSNSLNEIIEEFEMVRRYHHDKDMTKLAITPKEIVKQNLGRSPDFSDAIVMRYWFELNKTRITYFA